MMERVFLITGANRGIGRAICEGILGHPDNRKSSIKLHVTSRDGDDFGLIPANAEQTIVYHALDINDLDSIRELQRRIDQLDILINNAGVNVGDDLSLEGAKRTLDTNYRGTLTMCTGFIPKMRHGGRIVNLSSTASSLRLYPSDIQQRFRSASELHQVETLADEYISSLGQPDSIWPSIGKSYSVSKACINAVTQILAKQNPNIRINCCCPGWVDTGMGRITGSAPKSPEQGARIPVHLAMGDIGDVTGQYWGNDSISGTGVGKVQPW